MEAEKISTGGAVSYQGSVTAQKTAVAQGVEVQKTAVAGQPAAAWKAAYAEPECGKATAEDKPVLEQQLKNTVNALNRQLNGSEAIFGIHEKTNRVTIKIVDKETKKVIKEYPSEQTLDMIAKVWENAGILVDEKF